MHKISKLAGVACGAAALLAFGAGPALAASGSVHANLKAIEGNGVDDSGTAMVKVDGTTLTVSDHGEAAPAPNGSGYGLTGMRERAELLGGRLHAGPTHDGFRVELWLPA